MTDLQPNLVAVATAHGVATEYWDWRGEYVEVAAETIVAVLSAMGIDASSEAAAEAALVRVDAERWRRMLPACLVRRVDDPAPTTFWVHVPHGDPVQVHLELEDGGVRHDLRQLDSWVDPAQIDDALVGEATFALPADLPLGWHRIHARSPARSDSTTLVVVPRRVEPPAALIDRQIWGLMTQLYQVRTEASWGFGDFAALGELIAWSAEELHAGFVLVNPLHAGAPIPPIEPSPYLPMTRRFVSPLYLSIEEVPELADAPPAVRERIAELGARLQVRGGPNDLIDRGAVWTAKREAAELLHRVPLRPDRQAAFEAYRARDGVGLLDFATWSALVEVYGANWLAWPEELRNPATEAVAERRAELADRVDFHAWLQWQLDEQLARVAATARAAGMPIGVIGDLAVGVHPTGADSWALQDVLAIGASVGAPPDAFNQYGQDWSQPPWKPRQLAEFGYAPYRDLLRAALRHGGGLRVDHVLGLFRLWWVPSGGKPIDGTYVRYDHEALVGILALEAQRAGAVVIGEDLGTVEPWVRDYLAERGMFGTSILWFERDEQGPLLPEQWRRMCLGTVTTHDLPPTRGYLTGEHVSLRHRLGLLKVPVDQEWAALTTELAQWRAMLDELGIERGGAVGDVGATEATVVALHRFLAQAPCLLRGVSLADAAGDRRSHNQPGTYREYPNWELPLLDAEGRPIFLSDLRDSPRVAELAAVFRAAAQA
ncbi:MAG TPA: 4-alpha-glucanotransferase [Sporichthyaceae bacterium]|nr:4-alpha-glucanotransferase [Sporichthyaceae bacterium]